MYGLKLKSKIIDLENELSELVQGLEDERLITVIGELLYSYKNYSTALFNKFLDASDAVSSPS